MEECNPGATDVVARLTAREVVDRAVLNEVVAPPERAMAAAGDLNRGCAHAIDLAVQHRAAGAAVEEEAAAAGVGDDDLGEGNVADGARSRQRGGV